MKDITICIISSQDVFSYVLTEIKYIYPAVFIEEPYDSQIMNKKKTKHANEFYEFK